MKMPLETINVPEISFLGEQVGPAEATLKAKLVAVFASRVLVRNAYLAPLCQKLAVRVGV